MMQLSKLYTTNNDTLELPKYGKILIDGDYMQFDRNDENYVYGFIGKNVRKYRKAKGLTQAKLAEKANYSKQFISNIENNVHQTFSIGTLWRLSLILGVDLYKLCIEEKKEQEYEEMY